MQVLMPGYGSHSAYAYALQARGDRWGWNDIDSKTSVFSHDPDLQPHQHMAVMSAVQPGQTFIPMDEVIEFTEPFTFILEHGMAMLKGKVALNPDYLNRARLKFQYWPDAANRPGLTLTPRPNGIDFQEVRD